ncbi:RNA polymerase sigma factor [uncultured Caudovirales phage]|uniref:RNA polymerase sigma-like factor n=1 Tax=uncultured Caudovirales phage TaxID=2100421 RepID=A0A6J5M6Q7_9CAUD|nr:RNA polymerase sigma factor [uncultured Caudovirales phage]
MPKDNNKVHYVNNAQFLEHMKIHIQSVKDSRLNNTTLPKVSDYIGECIQSIAIKLANKPNFVNYPFREEMISDGIENSLQYINNFDPSKSSNPFAYFTQIIYYAFVRRIQREKKQLYTKYRLIEETLSRDMSEHEYMHNSRYGSEQADINMHEFLDNFEKSREKKKNKIKETKDKKLGFDVMFEQFDEPVINNLEINELDEEFSEEESESSEEY